MVKDSDVVPLILDVLKELNGTHLALPPNLGTETPLYGQTGVLDSLGLVSLIVGVEQAIEDRFGAPVSLADEKAMSQKHSPYRTVGSLAEFAARQLPG